MTIKTKLAFNAIVVLAAISIIVAFSLLSMRTINRNVSELTQKTTPYQLKALNQQRALQSHATNLVNLSISRTMKESEGVAAIVSESLSQVKNTSAEMAKLKAESSKGDKAIAEITKSILDITEQKIRAQEAVLKASIDIQGKMAEALKRMNELDKFAKSIQVKTSGSMISDVDSLVASNQQLNSLVAVRDGLKDLTIAIAKIPVTMDKRSVAGLRDGVTNTAKGITQALKNVKDIDKTANEISQKLASLGEKVSGNKGLAALQLKFLGDEDEKLKEGIETLAKEAVYEISYMLPTVEKEINNANARLKGNTEAMSKSITAFSDTNDTLSLATGLSLLSSSLVTRINECIHVTNLDDFSRQISLTSALLKDANNIGNRLKDQLTQGKRSEELKLVTACMVSIGAVSDKFSSKEGVAEIVKASIKNKEELEKLNGQMRSIVAQQLGDSNKDVSQAGVNQENVVSSLNQTAKRTVAMTTIMGGIIIIITLLMNFLISRSITKPINRVSENLREGADQVASSSSQVRSASQSLAEGASSQASSLEETSSSLEEMSSMTKQNADHANQAKAMMAEANQIIEKVSHHMTDMAGAVVEITKSSEETGKIIKTIDEIAFQTNLLALNAAVEAARAGEAGAGFAVVASEVRNLAIRASEAAKNTSNLIENTIRAVRKGNELTNATQEAFKENAAISKKIGQLVDEIATASEEQSHGITQVNTAVAEMDKVTQSTAASAEESAAASEELNAQAEQMKVFVEDLVRVVGGSGHAAGSRGNGGGLPRSRVSSKLSFLREEVDDAQFSKPNPAELSNQLKEIVATQRVKKQEGN